MPDFRTAQQHNVRSRISRFAFYLSTSTINHDTPQEFTDRIISYDQTRGLRIDTHYFQRTSSLEP